MTVGYSSLTIEIKKSTNTYNLYGLRRTGRFSFWEIPTTVEVSGEQIRIVTRITREVESNFFRDEIKRITFCLYPILGIADVVRILIFFLLLFISNGGAFFAIILSVKLMMMWQVQFELKSGKKIRIPIIQKADASDLLREFDYPISEIKKNNLKALSEKKWKMREWIVTVFLLALAFVTLSMGMKKYVSKDEKSSIEIQSDFNEEDFVESQKNVDNEDVEEPISLEEAGGYAQWEANNFAQDVRTDIIVYLPVEEREENNYAVSIGTFATDNIIIMESNGRPAKEWEWLMNAQPYEEYGEKAYFKATLSYTGNRAENNWPIFIVSNIESYDIAENNNYEDIITLPVTIINNTGVDIYELYASVVDTEEWEEDILNNGILFAGEEIIVDFTFGVGELWWDWAIVDEYGNTIEFYDLDFSVCNLDSATLILEYDGETGYATLQ